jgi:hypothetical protein
MTEIGSGIIFPPDPQGGRETHIGSGIYDSGDIIYGQESVYHSANVDYTKIPLTDHAAYGPNTDAFNAGESITVMDLCYLGSNGRWFKTDANNVDKTMGILSIALESKEAGQKISVALSGGFVRDDSWNWTLTNEEPVTLYVGIAAGSITITQPNETDMAIRVVGWAVTSKAIYFHPSADTFTHI